MKTIEEKAKAYDEAFERAKQVKLTDTKENVAAAEYIFPDLKESEDERIRKEMIKYFTEIKSTVPLGSPNHFDGYIAYLEKQKGNSLSLVDAWKEMRPEVFAQASGNKPKPVEKQDYSGLNDFERAIHRGFLCAGVENVPVTIIKETAKECMAKNKPAEWSKEDETQRINTIIFLQTPVLRKVYQQSQVDKAVEWLRNLCPQPKQEWSEEDERILKGVIGKIDHDQTYGVSKAEMLSFLKRLRPSLKLSEEQMKELKEVINNVK